MFCSSCGTAVAQGLSYCNRCGTRLSVPHRKLADVATHISMATGFVTLGGLFLTFIFAKKLMEMGMAEWALIALVICNLLVISGVAGLLIKQLSRVLSVYLQSSDGGAKKSEMSARQTAQIEAPRDPVFSVIDHTTRTFEPIYRERDTDR